jgi:hypothetical protein
MLKDNYYINREFDTDEILCKLSEIDEKLEKVRSEDTVDRDKERDLIYAKFIQGLKLSTTHTNGNCFGWF